VRRIELAAILKAVQAACEIAVTAVKFSNYEENGRQH